MKFICPCSALRDEIEYANSFAGRRNSLSITSNVYLSTANDELLIKASDQSFGFSSAIEVNTIVSGATTVFCDKLYALLKSMPDVDIEVSYNDGSITIKPIDEKIDFKASIKTIDADKFPELEAIDDSFYFTIAQREYFDMIDKTIFAIASKDDTRYFLTGVYMEKKDDKLVMVGTDGKRLSCVRRSFEHEIPDFQPVIINDRFLHLLQSIGTGDGVFSIAADDGKIFAKIGNRTIYAPIIVHNYPNYERVIPQNLENFCVVRTDEAIKAISIASIFVESKAKKIFVNIKEGKMSINSDGSDYGESSQSINCSYTGPESTFSFNYDLLLDQLKRVDSEYFRISFRTPSSALTISPDPEKDYIFVLMPMV